MSATQLLTACKDLSDFVLDRERFPSGPPVYGEWIKSAGDACVLLCEGNQDTARTLWKLVVHDCGGYMPQAAALALIRASATLNLVPDVTPEDPS